MNIIKRALVTTLAAGLTLGLTAPVASANSSPGCVTKREASKLYEGQTPGSVKYKFGTAGFEKGRYEQFLYDGVSDYDEFGTWVGYEPEFFDEETGEYTEEQGGYYRELDLVRSYKKCRSYDKGKGRVGVLFDNYSYFEGSLGAYAADRYHPSYLEWWKFLKVTKGSDHTAGKPKPNLARR